MPRPSHAVRRLDQLPLHPVAVPPEAPRARLEALLRQDPARPGVLVLDGDGRLVGVLGRRAVLEEADAPWLGDAPRATASQLLAVLGQPVLWVTGDTAPAEAQHRALARGPHGALEPLVVDTADGPALLDLAVLLRARSAALLARTVVHRPSASGLPGARGADASIEHAAQASGDAAASSPG